MKNSDKLYLLIDYGNSYIKAAIYNQLQKKIIESVQIRKTTKAKDLLQLFKQTNLHSINKIIEVYTSNINYVEPFNKQLSNVLKTKIKLVSQSDFSKVLNLSKIDKNVYIGLDILVSLFYIYKTIGKGAIASLGTVYYIIVGDKNKFVNCYLFPSVPKLLKNVSLATTIPHDYLPKIYDTKQGKDTSSCFASGVYLAIDGFIKNIIKNNNLKTSQVIISGGDAFRFPLLLKQYKEVKNVVLEGLALLIEEKKW